MSMLPHSGADIVRRLLIAKGKGVTPSNTPPYPDWQIYDDSEPNSPDNVITVRDIVGRFHGRSMINGEVWQHYGFQVRVRSTTKPIGWAMARSIYKTMAVEVYDDTIVIAGTAYLVECIVGLGDILSLGKDTPNTKRSLFTINALASIRSV